MKDDRLYLAKINDAIEKILRYTQGGKPSFLRESLIQDATIRNFQVIGEATKSLSDVSKTRHPEIPWRRIAGFRDVLIHDYMGVEMNEVWNVIEQELPALQSAVQSLLK